MNPDVFITMAFAGIVALMALVTLVFVVPKLRRADARAQSREGETGSDVGSGT
jgi:membrane protein YdbS with pleckstrin-like domain